ncbi:hypothetical protein ABT023_16365 [Micromonospora sp. NPDC002296]|uniref:hypothetical protein n=1 Tax=Micromonospora sp. NPDC002296 TaxID=3154271 RepID=UPI003328239C
MTRAYTGLHRPETVQPVGDDWRLSPAAQQLVTRTADPVHAGPADATGLLDVRDIPSTNAWTTPAVVAGLRANLTAPAAGPLARWAASVADESHHPISDEAGNGKTTDGPHTPKDEA